MVVVDLGKKLLFKSITYIKLAVYHDYHFSRDFLKRIKQVEVGRIFSFYVREIVLFFRDRVTTLFFIFFHTLAFLSCLFGISGVHSQMPKVQPLDIKVLILMIF